MDCSNYFDALWMLEDLEDTAFRLARRLTFSSVVRKRIREIVCNDDLSPVALLQCGKKEKMCESYGILLELTRDAKGELGVNEKF